MRGFASSAPAARTPPRVVLISCRPMSDWFTTHAAVITAGATVLYLVTTALLWHQTKRSADAATKSADTAKKSADAATAFYRPFIGLETKPIENLSTHSIWTIPVALRNYGALPATHLNASFDFHTESPEESRILLKHTNGPESAEIPPQSAYEIDLYPAVNNPTQNQVALQQKKLILTLKATYGAPDDRKFEYTAEARLSIVSKRLVVQKSRDPRHLDASPLASQNRANVRPARPPSAAVTHPDN